jgi:tetratricopeptide (TPR) repeat protein
VSRDESDKGDQRDEDESEAEASADQPDADVERDASTVGVAEALGVDRSPEEIAAEEEAAAVSEEAKAPANRSARRREQALVRRKKKAPKATEGDDAAVAAGSVDADLPLDKNARAKELLKRRQKSVSGSARVASGLDTGEIVQDALARGSSAAGTWFRDNVRYVVAGVAVVLLGAGGFLFFQARGEAKAGSATGALTEALAADRGRVMKEDKRTDEEKQVDPTRVFTTSDDRASAAIEAYQKALSASTEPGPTTLARLGLAGAQLEKGETQAAIDTYAAVLSSPLANADVDVRGRAIEGTGLALETKGDLDGALKQFEDLAKVDAKGFEELGLYHQARVHAQRGDKEKAKELLKKAREKLSAPGEVGQAFPFLEAVVDGHLRSLDPSAAPARMQLGGAKGNSMSPEDLDRLQEQMRKALEKRAGEQEQEHGHEGEEGGPGGPAPGGPAPGGPGKPVPQQEPQ